MINEGDSCPQVLQRRGGRTSHHKGGPEVASRAVCCCGSCVAGAVAGGDPIRSDPMGLSSVAVIAAVATVARAALIELNPSESERPACSVATFRCAAHAAARTRPAAAAFVTLR